MPTKRYSVEFEVDDNSGFARVSELVSKLARVNRVKVTSFGESRQPLHVKPQASSESDRAETP